VQAVQAAQRFADSLSATPRKHKDPAQAQLRLSSVAQGSAGQRTEHRDAQAIPAVAMTYHHPPIAPCSCPSSALRLRVALPTPHAWYHRHCTHDTHGTHLALALQAPNHALALVALVVGFHTPCPARDAARCRRRLAGCAAAAATCQCRHYTDYTDYTDYTPC
jgi:hypothetical protein